MILFYVKINIIYIYIYNNNDSFILPLILWHLIYEKRKTEIKYKAKIDQFL